MVTGGAGFIGSHMVDLLMKEGHAVVVVDNLSSGKNIIEKLAQGISPTILETAIRRGILSLSKMWPGRMYRP